MFARLRLAIPVSNNIIPMTPSRRAAKSALDEFLPERLFAPEVQREQRVGASNLNLLPPNEVRLDPVEQVHRSAPVKEPSGVQLWPMLAAAFVAFGVTLLALAVFSKYSYLAL